MHMSDEEKNARAAMKTIINNIKYIYYKEINDFLETVAQDNLPHVKKLY
jgi:hypothetical protein